MVLSSDLTKTFPSYVQSFLNKNSFLALVSNYSFLSETPGYANASVFQLFLAFKYSVSNVIAGKLDDDRP